MHISAECTKMKEIQVLSSSSSESIERNKHITDSFIGQCVHALSIMGTGVEIEVLGEAYWKECPLS